MSFFTERCAIVNGMIYFKVVSQPPFLYSSLSSAVEPYALVVFLELGDDSDRS